MPQKDTLAKAAARQPSGAAGYLQIAETGQLWTAPSGAVIRVRDISVLDRATMGTLPEHLQVVVNDILDKSVTLRADDDDEETAMTLMQMLSGEEKKLGTALDRMYEIGIHLCIAGWIEPEVVPTPADITDPERQIPATKILTDDRNAFMGRVFGTDMGEAQKLATFPEQ